ncbi:MAG: hypothetical protein JST42_24090 [Bacteroidetes bacterium]|nr:hypothetical protein [Bacteroidota bacterium]
MNLRSLLTLSAVVFFAASCKKNSDSSPSGVSSKLKLYIEDASATPYGTIDTFAVGYDNNNRITSLSGKSLRFAYAYTGSTGFTMDLFEQGLLSIHEMGFIKGSYVDSTFQVNNTQDTTTEKYIYSGTQLASRITYDYSGGRPVLYDRENYTYDGNGNLIKTVQLDGTTTTYTYTDKPFQLTVNPSYYPVQAKNLPATEKQTDGGGNVVATVAYTYEFDNQGRVVKETDALSGGFVVVKLYVYQ